MLSSTLQEDLHYITGYPLPYEKLHGKTVLVTGATGLIGVSIVRALLTIGGINVIALVRNEDKARKIYVDFLENTYLKIYVGDILDEISVEDPVEYIFHCASVTASKLMVEKPVETLVTSVEGTKNILNFSIKKRCTSIVYISSMEVYGTFDASKDVKETELGYIDNLKVRSNYPESKRLCENMCIAYLSEYGVPVKIARLAQTFGAGILPGENRVFAQFARSAMAGTDIVLHTKGISEGNYCYIRDCITGLFTILLKGLDGEAYNVCNSQTHTTIAEMADMVARKITNGKIQVVYDLPAENVFGYASDVKMKLNSDKLQKLGWEPKVNLEEAYRRMISDVAETNLW